MSDLFDTLRKAIEPEKMNPTSELFLLSIRERAVQKSIQWNQGCIDRATDRLVICYEELKEVRERAAKLNKELEEQQTNLYKYGK